jgi:hypothetical protein
MQYTASGLAFLAILSLFGVLGPVFLHDERGIFFLVGGVALFAVFAALSALLFVTAADSDFS